MLNKLSMLLATAAVVLGAGAANGAPYDQNQQGYDRNNNRPTAASDQNQSVYGNG